MARPSFFRRKIYIKKQFQGRFVLLYTLFVSIVVGLGMGVLYWQIGKAVEQHLYSTHLRIERVGDFLADLMFNTNFIISIGIILVVLALSLIIFRRINHNFSKMDLAIQAMAQGDFTHPFVCDKCFLEAGELRAILERTRIEHLYRFQLLQGALNDLEGVVMTAADQTAVLRGKEKLALLLENISLA